MPEIILVLPEIGLLLLAGLALMITAVIGIVIVYPFAKSIRTLPIVGDNLGDAVKGFWDSLTQGVQSQVDTQVRNISDLIDFASGMVQGLLNATTTTAEWLGLQVGNATTLALNVAGDLVTQGAHLLALVQAGAQALADLAAKVEALASQVIDRVLQAVAHQIAETTSQLHVALAAEIKVLTHPLHAFIVQVHAQLRAALTDETNRAVSAEAGLHGQVIDARTAVEAELDAVRTAVLRRLGGVEGTLQGEIGTITDIIGTVAAGTTLVGLIEGIATTVTTMERECVEPTCGFLSPQLPILNALMDVGTMAIFAGLIGAAVSNPKGTAGVVADGVASMHGLYAPVFNGLTGLSV